ncbi:hypothetical protein HRI_003020700 [Hibiscus trionum]|uniref:CCHC-type domain-containing protein n=1 Tax=Hibiscus trionum TaxID=183268 RepID=A0A9W7MAP4_HIBTR|nr:hypothetical protein HRI_003020700 [Hibiscus trionum]
MESELAALSIEEGEEEILELPPEVQDVVDPYDLCLVGRFLTSSVIHFLAMRNTMADVCHPLGGISVTDIGEKRICFKFYHEIDISRVLEGSPWFFNNHLLLLHRLLPGEDPLLVPLNLVNFWVQVHDLPPGLMSEPMARQFGNFVGQFVEYDSKLLISGRKHFMRIKVMINVNQPLKRRKKISLGKERTTYVRFQYERLSLFCFICGKLGHGESFCPLRLTLEPSAVTFGWDLSLRAPVRRALQPPSVWLREEISGTALVDIKAVTDMHGKLTMHDLEGDVQHNMDSPRGKLLAAKDKLFYPTVALPGGQMEIGSDNEENALPVLDGKKRQRLVGDVASVSATSDSAAHEVNNDQTAGSARQGSRLQ